MLSILCSRMSPVCGEKRYVEFLGACVRQPVSGLWTEEREEGGGYVHVPPAPRAAHACGPGYAEADEEALLAEGAVLALGAAFGVW